MATFKVTFKDRKKTLQITTQAFSIEAARDEVWDIVKIKPSSLQRL
jgi:hypothetical protein